MAGRISAGQEGAPCALTSACLTGLAELAIKRLLPIRLAQPRTTSCGWVVGAARSGRAKTGTLPPVPAGGRGGPSRRRPRHEATAAALLGREAVLRLAGVREAEPSRGANARGSRHNI